MDDESGGRPPVSAFIVSERQSYKCWAVNDRI